MIGAGFGFALLPALRALYGADPDRLDAAIERHAGLFNSHPYLASLALGAVAALEAEAEATAGLERFKSAIRGSLGTLGDRLVWIGWRPFCLLCALALLLGGAPWWAGLLGFLLIYNAGHLALRVWGFNLGFRHPQGIGEQLRRLAIDRLQSRLTTASAFLVGITLPLVAAGAQTRSWLQEPSQTVDVYWLTAGVAGALVGAHLGGRVRTPVIMVLIGFSIVALISGSIQ
jgi:PTS system mannose-specific IID component